MGRRKVITTEQENYLRGHIPQFLIHQAKRSLDAKFYPPIYEEFFGKWPVPAVTAAELTKEGGDLAAAKKIKYLAFRHVRNAVS